MTLDHFTYPKEVVIDEAGWSDLLLGVVVGALKPPDARYMERRISTSSFQPPNFEKKKYLDDAVKIAEEIIEVTQPDEETQRNRRQTVRRAARPSPPGPAARAAPP